MIALTLHTRTYAAGDHRRESLVSDHALPRMFRDAATALPWVERAGLTGLGLPLEVEPYAELQVRMPDYDGQGRPVVRSATPLRAMTPVDEWGLLVRLVHAAPATVHPDPSTVPDIGEVFEHRGHRFRVSGWLRRTDRTPLSADYGPDRCALVFCDRDDAEYVTGSGVSGVLVRVAEAHVVGRVDWSYEAVETARESHRALIGRPVG